MIILCEDGQNDLQKCPSLTKFLPSCNLQRESQSRDGSGPLTHHVVVALASSNEIKLRSRRLLVFGFMLNTSLNSRRCRRGKGRLSSLIVKTMPMGPMMGTYHCIEECRAPTGNVLENAWRSRCCVGLPWNPWIPPPGFYHINSMLALQKGDY